MNFENQYLLSTQYRDILEALMGMDYILRIAYEVTGSIDHISTFVKQNVDTLDRFKSIF